MSYWYPQHFTVFEPASERAQRTLNVRTRRRAVRELPKFVFPPRANIRSQKCGNKKKPRKRWASGALDFQKENALAGRPELSILRTEARDESLLRLADGSSICWAEINGYW